MNNTIKNLGITVGIIVVLATGLYLYSKFYLTNEQVGLTAEDLNANFPGKDIKEKLDSITSLHLEAGAVLFADTAYRNLSDGTINLGSEPAGRSNPFAPVFRNVSQPIVPAATKKASTKR